MTTYQEHLKTYYNKLEECYEHMKKQDTNIRYFHTIFKDESERLSALEILDKNFEREHSILLTELTELFKIKIKKELEIKSADEEGVDSASIKFWKGFNELMNKAEGTKEEITKEEGTKQEGTKEGTQS